MCSKRSILIGILCGAFGAVTVHAGDPHQVYESNCAECHPPHAGDFAHENLEFKDSELRGANSGQPVRAFLEAGHGRLTQAEIDLLMDHFVNIQESGRLFRRKCAICHVRAIDVARQKLVIRDGELYGRYSGVDTMSFLTNHGRLASEELPVMVEVLKRLVSQRAGPGAD